MFSVDQYVYHLGKHTNKPDALARVTDAWHDGEEMRYYVVHHGFTWSVPEWALRLAPASKQRSSSS